VDELRTTAVIFGERSTNEVAVAIVLDELVGGILEFAEERIIGATGDAETRFDITQGVE
jgi:hypothetical protein